MGKSVQSQLELLAHSIMRACGAGQCIMHLRLHSAESGGSFSKPILMALECVSIPWVVAFAQVFGWVAVTSKPQ